MITPIKTMTINQIIARQDDLLVSVDDVKAIAKNERSKLIDEFVEKANEEVYKDFNFADIGEYSINDVALTLYRVAEQLKEQK